MAGHCDNVHLYFLSLPPNSFAIFMELHVFFFYPRIKIFQQKKKEKRQKKKKQMRIDWLQVDFSWNPRQFGARLVDRAVEEAVAIARIPRVPRDSREGRENRARRVAGEDRTEDPGTQCHCSRMRASPCQRNSYPLSLSPSHPLVSIALDLRPTTISVPLRSVPFCPSLRSPDYPFSPFIRICFRICFQIVHRFLHIVNYLAERYTCPQKELSILRYFQRTRSTIFFIFLLYLLW